MSSLTVKFKSSVFFLAAVVGAGKVLISFNKNNHLDDGDPYSSISTAERHECSQTERVFEKSCPRMMKMLLCLVPCLLALTGDHVVALSLSSSSLFLGSRLSSPSTMRSTSSSSSSSSSISNRLTMRKQKASDRRTRRRQRGLEDFTDTNEALSAMLASTFTVSPMKVEGSWKHKTGIAGNKGSNRNQFKQPQQHQGGRGRSRKRRALYNSLAFYHNHFLNLLTSEYKAEEEEVLGRIDASIDDPLGLETAGFALFDLDPQRRGNLYSDEVYRLTKAVDATTTYQRSILDDDEQEDISTSPSPPRDSQNIDNSVRYLPPNHKFSQNDVIMLTLQPKGSGDFFGTHTLPTNKDEAISVEARVLNLGPTYVDVAISAGSFEAAFGPAPNDLSQKGNKSLRLRADRFISKVPYERMVAALAQISSIPERQKRSATPEEAAAAVNKDAPNKERPHDHIHMDELIRETILSTHAMTEQSSPSFGDPDICDVQDLANKLSKPPMATSLRLASQAMKHIRSNPDLFREFNAPQQAAIEASLSRRLTMIQGPPGSGKTTVAAAIAFGFVHQCRTISPHAKVLSCAFSNVGADNLAEALVRLGLKVIRVGKPSAVSEALWEYTLDAAIDNDPVAQKAMKLAAKATAQLGSLSKKGRGKSNTPTSFSETTIRDAATAAVKASIEACNLAATKALREADVIVSTSTGAADARLMAACGIVTGGEMDKLNSATFGGQQPPGRENAPDDGPPLSLPFVIIDEACQSVEPASLIPIVSSDSCRSLVLLGDPCQLPPTVRSGYSNSLSVSLMERLSSTLPHPVISSQVDSTIKDESFLKSLPIKQARSLLKSMETGPTQRSYRKRFGGSLLLSVQYRMHPSISAFPSAIFYDGQLSTPMFMAEQRSFPSALDKIMPCGNSNICVRAIDVGGGYNEQQGRPTRYSRTVFGSGSTPQSSLEEKTTYWNQQEANRVLSLIKDILQDEQHKGEVNSIGVISPYNGQVALVKSMISSDQDLRQLLLKSTVTIEVKSVDGYQGRERDVIIFSAVRSNRQGRIGFLHDWRRLNVALTRAKSGLVVVGDFDTLAGADRHWAAFSKWSKGARVVVNDFDEPEDEPSL